jgi:hypothetical protein
MHISHEQERFFGLTLGNKKELGGHSPWQVKTNLILCLRPRWSSTYNEMKFLLTIEF